MAPQFLSRFALTDRGLAEPWRLLSCHVIHWTWEHAALNGVAFLCPFLALQGSERRRLAKSLFVVAPLLSLGLMPFLSGGAYAGLSGLTATGWAFAGIVMTARRGRRGLGFAFLALLATKLSLELLAGGSLLLREDGWTNLPVAHAMGAAMGMVAALVSGRIRHAA